MHCVPEDNALYDYKMIFINNDNLLTIQKINKIR